MELGFQNFVKLKVDDKMWLRPGPIAQTDDCFFFVEIYKITAAN